MRWFGRSSRDFSLVNTVLIVLLLVAIGTTLWFSRYFIVTPQDTAHLQDLFDHSQWRIPLSTRTISDNQLYYVAGVALSEGADPFSINPEVPPAGKYLYGWGHAAFGTAFMTSVLLYLAVIALSWHTARLLRLSQARSLLAAVLVALSPALSSQVAQTMLDLPLTFFLLLHIWSLAQWQRLNPVSQQKSAATVRAKASAKNRASSERAASLNIPAGVCIIVAGLALAGFAGSKFPLLVPAVVVADVFFIWRFMQAWKARVQAAVVLFGAAGVGFAALYTQYFLEGNSLIAWVRSLYWTIQFYLMGSSDHPYGQVLPGVLFGRHLERNFGDQTQLLADNTVVLVETQRAVIREWSITWAVGLLSVWVVLWQWLRQVLAARTQTSKQRSRTVLPVMMQTLVVLVLAYIGTLALVDFKGRYFFPLIPVLALVIVWVLPLRKRVVQVLVGLGVGVLLVQYLLLWLTPPTETLKEISRTWGAGHYADLYSFTFPGSTGLTRDGFHDIFTRQFEQNVQVQSQIVTLNFPEATLWQRVRGRVPGKGMLEITTPETSLTLEHELELQRSQGQWFLVWDWELYNGILLPGCSVTTSYQNLAGELRTSDGVLLSRYQPVEYLRLNLEQLPLNQDTLQQLAVFTNNEYARAEAFFLITTQGQEWVDLPIPMQDLTPEQLATFPERQTAWVRYERRISDTVSERLSQLRNQQRNQGLDQASADVSDSTQKIEQLEELYPAVEAPPTLVVERSCEDDSRSVVLPGSRSDVTLDQSFSEVFSTF